MFKLDLEKAEEPEIKLPTSVGPSKKQESSRKKHLLLLYWPHQSLWLCGSQQTGKFFKRWEYQTTLPASWEICMQVKEQQLELDMEKQIGSKSVKAYVKAVYCHPAYLTWAPLVAQMVKASTCNARDPGPIPGLGRSPGEGNGNRLQYSCLENSIDGGTS